MPPELRRDALSGAWVLLAPNRAARPRTLSPSAPVANPGSASECPFCPGNEHETPPEVARTGDGAPDMPGWRVRVAPNRYPIVGDGAGPGATGAHEVVVLSPAHNRPLARLGDSEAAEAFLMMRDRARHHSAAGRVYVQVIINHGRAAGASLAHPHAQLVALDVVPPAVRAAAERFDVAGSDLVKADADDARRHGLDLLGGPVRAWCPWAANLPYQIRIAFDAAGGRFDEATDEEMTAVALACRDGLRLLADAIGDAAYNLVIHTAPGDHGGDFHWYVDVQPRLGILAGFELSTGVGVNDTDPAEAAARLRDVIPTTRRR